MKPAARCQHRTDSLKAVLWIWNDLFRIQLRFFGFPDPTYIFKDNLEIIKNTLISIKKKNILTIGSFLCKVQFYSTHSPELEIQFLIISSFIFSWIRIRNKNPDPGKSSGSMRIRIHNAAWSSPWTIRSHPLPLDLTTVAYPDLLYKNLILQAFTENHHKKLKKVINSGPLRLLFCFVCHYRITLTFLKLWKKYAY